MWDMERTFLAAQQLALMAYGPDLYQNGKEEYKHTRGDYHYRYDLRRALPLRPPGTLGALGTTGGLSIYTHNHWPIWMETPWGEWRCWGGDYRYSSAGYHVMERFRASLQVDERRSRRGVIALRGVGEVGLPPYEQCEPRHSTRDWVRLCLKHDLPFGNHEYWIAKFAQEEMV